MKPTRIIRPKPGTQDVITVRTKQKVHLGQSRSGRWGLFTGQYMAWPLWDDEVPRAREIAERAGFEWEESNV